MCLFFVPTISMFHFFLLFADCKMQVVTSGPNWTKFLQSVKMDQDPKRMILDPKGNLSCPGCQVVFATEDKMLVHKKEHATVQTKCNPCGMLIHEKRKTAHAKSHLSTKLGCKCSAHSDEIFDTYEDFNRHANEWGETGWHRKEVTCCSICLVPLSFSLMANHFKEKHFTESEVYSCKDKVHVVENTCHVCNFTCVNSEQLEDHVCHDPVNEVVNIINIMDEFHFFCQKNG